MSATSLSPAMMQAIFTSTPGVNPQTKTGWQALLRAGAPVKPTAKTLAEHRRMPPAERDRYDTARRVYHSSLNQIATPQMLHVHERLTDALAMLAAPSVVCRTGVMLSGEANVGKSTSLVAFGQHIERAARAQTDRPLPEPGQHRRDDDEYLPVAYFSADSSVGGTLFNGQRFYDHVVHPKLTVSQRGANLAERINRSSTRLVLIDQVQEIRSAKSGPQSVSGAIKALMDACTQTLFVGAGIGIEHLDVFSDGFIVAHASLAQTGGRFALLPVPSMRPTDADPTSGTRWLALLNTAESSFLLLKAQPGDIMGLSDYLLNRTGGMTGAVMKLLRDGANLAITSGQERINERLLRQVMVSAQRDLASGAVNSAVPIHRKKPA